MTGRDPLGKESDLALRMRQLRTAVSSDNAAAFAAKLGLTPQRWNNFENGMPVSHAVAMILVEKIPGLTLDWVHRGVRSGLTLDVAAKLDAAEAALSTKRKRRSGD